MLSALALALVRLGTRLLAARAGCPVVVTLDIYTAGRGVPVVVGYPGDVLSLTRTYGGNA